MEHSGEGVGVYAEAKGEYTRQLCQFLNPALQKFFLSLLDTAKEREPEPKKLLLSFQTLLENISDWNIDKVQRETQNVAMSTQCDYMEELLTAVFVAHTKVLSAIRLTNKQRKLQITIPKLDHFLHKTLIECARLLWTNTFLFSPNTSSIERQKNMRLIEGLIMDGILQGIRAMLPVKSILREYLSTDDTDTEAEEEDAEEEDAEEEEEEAEEKEDAEAEEEGAKDAELNEKKKEEEKPVEKPPAPTPETQPVKQESESDFDPSKFDIFSAAQPVASKQHIPPVETPSVQSIPNIPTIYLEEPKNIEFTELNTAMSKNNSGITDEIISEAIEFEEI